MFYFFGVNVFVLLFAISVSCFALYTYDFLQGRVTLRSKWRDLTAEQWFFFIGGITLPLWIIGIILTVDK